MSLINQMLRDLEQRLPNDTATAKPVMPVMVADAKPASQGYWALLVMVSLVAGGSYLAWHLRLQTPSTPVAVVAPVVPAPVDAATPKAVSPLALETSSTIPVNAEPAKSAEAIHPPASPIQAHDSAEHTAHIAVESSTKPNKALSTSPGTPKKTKAGRGDGHTQSVRHHSATEIERLKQQLHDAASLTMRKEILKEILALVPDDLPTRDQLLAIELKTAPIAEQESFLRDSLMLYPQHLAFVTSLARLQLQQNNAAAASVTLERAETAGHGDPAFLSLLAASYQQQKRFRDAAPLYHALTERQPEKAEHWLGLAICADNLQQSHTAIQAYQRALESQTLNGDVMLYIQQRLAALN